jgi:pimeloyl-ACP methyl ester carboxylesterase
MDRPAGKSRDALKQQPLWKKFDERVRKMLKQAMLRTIEAVRSPTRIQRARLRRRFRRAGLEEHQVDLANGSVHCWVGGNGPPLFLLHGFGASALWQWYPQVPGLSSRFTLYMPDLLFFGDSVSNSRDRSLRFQAETVVQLAEHFGVDLLDVVGLSYGGFVALTLASFRPDCVRRLCLVGCPGDMMREEDHLNMLDTFGVSQIHELLLPQGPEGVRRLMETAWLHPPRVPDFLLKDTLRTLFQNQVEEKRELLDDLLGELRDRSSAHAPAPRPTLILCGEHDRIFPPSLVWRLRERLGESAEFITMAHAAHAPNMERADAFNQLLLEFFLK